MKMKQLAFAIGMMGATGLACAYADDQAKSEEKIEVTGSSIKTSINKAGALPVQTIKREDIEKLGVTNTEQLLASISATQTAGATATTQSEGQTTWGLSAVSLRALGSKRTLVLVNGRRVANYATDGGSVDLSSIPLSAVERVEVLKDGASSTYGSDAVAGVVNFILRKNYQGFEISGYTGVTTRGGGGDIAKGGFVVGFGDQAKDRYNVLLSGDIEHDQQLMAANRSFANQATDLRNGIFDNSATPSGRVQTWYPAGSPQGGANGAVNKQFGSNGTLGNLADGNCAANGSYADPNVPDAVTSSACRYNAAAATGLIPQVDRMAFSGSGHFNVSDSVELYAEGIFTRTVNKILQQPSPISAAFLAPDPAFAANPGLDKSIVITPASPYYPTAWLTANAPGALGQDLSVSYRAFDGGGRRNKTTADLYRALAGVRGSFGSWDYDLAVSTSASTVEQDTEDGYELQTKLVQLLNACQCYNPVATYQTPATQALVRSSLYNGEIVRSKLTYNALDGKVSGPIVELPAGTLAVAAGFSLRHADLDYQSSAAAQSGDVSGYGGDYLPLSKGRSESSVFGEVNIPILDTLEADASVRGDHFARVGNTTNPKVSLRFQPFKQLLLRASYGTGFRAPTLPDLYAPAVFGNTNSFSDPYFPALLPNGQKNPLAAPQQWNQTVGGNANLKPEKSKQSSLGFILQPVKDFSLGVDFYHIRVDQAIQLPTPSTIVLQNYLNAPGYAGLVTRDPNTHVITNILASQANVGGINTTGADVEVNWRHKLDGVGTLTASLSGSYISKYDLTRPDGVVEQSVARTVVDSANDALAVTTNGGVILRWRHAASVGLSNATWNGSFTWNYQSGYQDSYANGFNPSTNPLSIASFSTYDAQIGYTGIKNLKLNLGVKNLFDRDPPVVSGTNLYFQTGFDPTYYDARARFVYVSGNYKFW